MEWFVTANSLVSVPLGQLLLAFAMCLAISALGFWRVDYFVSLGYAFSILAQAVVFTAFYWPSDLLLLGLPLLLAAYGLRLGTFLIRREAQPSFERERIASAKRGVRVKGGVRLAIWVSVSALYVLMFSPALFALTEGQASPPLVIGLVIMLMGLGIEGAADGQKSRFKAANPAAFCNVGLFAIVRSPNYFGEMLFWLGAFIAGLADYRLPLDWLMAGAGLVVIELIMLGAARRLELKQTERYGADPAFQAYVRHVPILFPLIPLHSLRRLRIYLG